MRELLPEGLVQLLERMGQDLPGKYRQANHDQRLSNNEDVHASDVRGQYAIAGVVGGAVCAKVVQVQRVG
jgi:hypothetical protein